MRVTKRSYPLDEWGDDVEVDGAVLPDSFTVITEHEDPETSVRLRVCLIDRRWEATELSFSNPDGVALDRELVADAVRRLPKLVKHGVLSMELMPLRTTDGRRTSAGDQVEFEEALDRRQRRRLIDADLLASVAEVYVAAPSAPAKAVEQHFVVSAATASRWIKIARERKFLDPKES